MSEKKWVPWLLLAPVLGGGILFFLMPFIITIYYSFTFGLTGRFVGLENYSKVFTSSTFRLAAANSIRFLAAGVVVSIILSFSLALLVFHRKDSMGLFRSVLLLPMTAGVAVSTLLIQYFFAENGTVNLLLQKISGEPRQWLQGSSVFGILLLLYLWKSMGYNIVLFLAGLNTIPREYYGIASVEGANRRQKLFMITIPMMRSTFFFVFIVSVINCFRVYREIFLIAGEHPDESIYMLQHYINNNFQNLNYQRLSVASVTVFLMVTVCVLIFYGWQHRDEDISI